MNKGLHIAILDENLDYMNSFRDYMLGTESREYQIYFFTSFVSLLKGIRGIHILVISENLMQERYLKNFHTENVLILTEEENVELLHQFHCVYRYQPIEKLLGEIVNYCIEHKIIRSQNFNYKKRNSENMISIFSGYVSENLERFPIMLSEYLVKRGYSVLYFNLTEFSVESKFGLEKTEGSVSDLFYFFLNHCENLGLKTDTVVGNFHGVEYVPATECAMDFQNCSANQLLNFIKEISGIRNKSVIIIFLSGMIPDYLEVLSRSSQVLIPYEKSCYGAEKKNRVKGYLLSQEEYLIQNILEVLVEDNGECSEETMDMICEEL